MGRQIVAVTSAVLVSFVLAAAAADDPASIERYRAALRANPQDSAARDALKGLIDRPAPVPLEQDERVRDILRQYPWPGRVRLAHSAERGTPMVVSGLVRGADGRPLKDALLHLFQTDAEGHYTRAAVMDEPHARLFGFLVTGADGRYEISTIRPGGYPGRPDRQGEEWRIPAHIHFEITAAGHQPRGFQMVFRDDPRMTPYWLKWAERGQHPVVTVVRGADGIQRGTHDIRLR